MQRLKTPALTMTLGLLLTSSAAAADFSPPLLFGANPYIGYALLLLSLVLGVVPLCWPSRRKSVKKGDR